jgi:hypothetical protein
LFRSCRRSQRQCSGRWELCSVRQGRSQARVPAHPVAPLLLRADRERNPAADHEREPTQAHDSLWIAYLAITTGLISLWLYYFGLKRTPAVIASLAELTYPDRRHRGHLRVQPTSAWSRWLGMAIIIGTVALLPIQRRRKMVSLPAPAAGARAGGGAQPA